MQNKSNFDAHYEGTGPEIWRQTNGNLDAFVSGAGESFVVARPSELLRGAHTGTGGTIAGTGRYLKSMDENIKVVLADPEGSGLYNKVQH